MNQVTQDKITPKNFVSTIEKESKWLLNAENLLMSTLDDSSCITSSAYHSSVQ